MSNSKSADNYNNVNDFLNDAGFINFHFKLNARDESWWQNWIEQHPDQTLIINEARGILNMLSFSIPDDEYNTELEKIKFAISNGTHAKQNKSIFRLPGVSKTSKVAVAATVLVLIVSGILLANYFTSAKKITDHFNSTTRNLTITLEDNTNVSLSPGSRLTYHTFSSTVRDVTLQGDGGFMVTKNKNAPFRVFTGHVVAIVLGTTFDIKSKGDSSVIVDLKTGSLKVGVFNNGTISQELLLKPDQSAVFNNHQLVMFTRTPAIDVAKTSDRHDVEFSRNDFLQIAQIINNVYGVVLVNESGTNNWKFSGQFKNSTAPEIVESICLIKGLTSSVKGDTIVIR